MINTFALTDPGRRRRNNEDRLLASAHLGLFVVADGMGGHQGGEEASQEVVRFFQETRPSGELTALQYLEHGFEQVNRRILDRAYREPRLEGMGSTATALLFDACHYNLMQIGDSRAYLYRDGRLQQMTRDDTLIQSWLDTHQITPAEAEYHPQRNQLTQALGREGVLFQPYRGLRRDGDVWLLCSDGLSGVLDDTEIEEWLGRSDLSPEQLCRRLVDRANERGGPDNISVVIIADAPRELARPSASTLPIEEVNPDRTEPDTPLPLGLPAARASAPSDPPETLPDQTIAVNDTGEPGAFRRRRRRFAGGPGAQPR